MTPSYTLKVQRAKQHIADANDLLKKRRPFRYTVETDYEAGERSIGAKRNEPVIADCVEELVVRHLQAALGATDELKPAASPGQRGFRHRDQSGHFPQVLGSGSQEELILGSIWSSEAQAIQLQDAFEVGEQHLDLLPLAPRSQIGVGFREVASQIAGAFMDRAQDLSARVPGPAA